METRTFEQSRFFKPLPSNPDYVIGIGGQVYSRPRTVIRCNGRPHRVRGRFMKPHDNGKAVRNGYPRRSVGALMLEAFVGPRPAGHECCHIDGDRFNNSLDNLRWGTQADNMADKLRHGTAAKRLTAAGVRGIRERVAAGGAQRAEARSHGVSESMVSQIVKRKAWKHLES